jgi:hypothetical protein
MTGVPSPVVRSLILCEDIAADPRNPRRITLVNLINSIRSIDEPPSPLRYRELCVFIQLTSCREQGELRLEIREADTEGSLFATRTRTVSFPNNPVAVHGLRFRIRNLTFPAPGLYWVQFWYNNDLLAQQPWSSAEANVLPAHRGDNRCPLRLPSRP